MRKDMRGVGNAPEETKYHTEFSNPALTNADGRNTEWPRASAELIGPVGAPPRFPLDLLPPELAECLAGIAHNLGVPVDYVVMNYLAILAGLIGNKRRAEPAPGWTVSPQIWALIIGDPASGKSRPMGYFSAMVQNIETELDAARREAVVKHERKEHLKALQRSFRDETIKSAFKRGIELPAPGAELDPDPAPPQAQFIVGDATLAGLEQILAENPHGVLLTADEGGALLSPSAGANARAFRQLLLTGSDGGAYQRRLATHQIAIPAVTIGIVANVQPAVLARVLPHIVEDGFGARFLPVAPAPVPFTRPHSHMDDGLLRDVLKKVRALTPAGTPTSHVPVIVPLSSKATNHHQAFCERTHDVVAGEVGLMAGVLGKSPAAVVRLATIFSYLDWAVSGTGQEPSQIDEAAVLRAIDFHETYVVPMARHSYAAADLNPSGAAARKLVTHLRKKKLHRFTRRDIARIGLRGLDNVRDLDHVLCLLEDEGLIRWVPDTTPRPDGGRPSVLYESNPRVFGPDFAGLF